MDIWGQDLSGQERSGLPPRGDSLLLETPERSLEAVLVVAGCSSRIPETGWFINNRHLFPTVLEAGTPRSGRQQIWCLVRAALLVHS